MKPLLAAVLIAALASPALAGDTSPAQVIAGFEAAAGAKADPARGKALFMASHTGGKPDTPSCTTCHTNDPRSTGKARTGKPIDPMAPSANPARFTETAQIEKWFGRNCNSVLGRDCTALEKADVVSWLNSL